MDQVSSLQMKIFHGQILKLEMFFGHVTKKKKRVIFFFYSQNQFGPLLLSSNMKHDDDVITIYGSLLNLNILTGHSLAANWRACL